MLESPNYELSFVACVAGVIFCCYLPANITAFLIVVIGYIEAQMLGLAQELILLWGDAEEYYYKTKSFSILNETEELNDTKNKIMNDYVEKHLKIIITTHGRNINLLRQIETVFRGAIVLEFFLLTVGLISELLGGLENTYLEVPFALICVGMDCFIGQRVIDAGVIFENAVYDCKWEHYNVTNMKIVLMMLQSSQKKMQLSAGGIIVLDFCCLMQIFNSVYSAYTTLRTTMD
ncbi:uncharacterized protein LOC113503754 [Trichoplusia ni]|uniref:Uncharacterized protein LOC113503754 n=1 Tax=Trichoplusia ni TaxID=7111 RepID=A0A7E5WLL0_TRINI|nr:uncharacterized protein LOC113503754 [Trichoplusia ni]